MEQVMVAAAAYWILRVDMDQKPQAPRARGAVVGVVLGRIVDSAALAERLVAGEPIAFRHERVALLRRIVVTALRACHVDRGVAESFTNEPEASLFDEALLHGA